MTHSIVAGDTITWTEPVFAGSFRSPRKVGERTIKALVLRESDGAGRGSHTFTLQVLAAYGESAPALDATIRRKGRNLYGNGATREPWANETTRQAVADEKHARGNAARARRAGEI